MGALKLPGDEKGGDRSPPVLLPCLAALPGRWAPSWRRRRHSGFACLRQAQYISPMPPPGIGGVAGFSSGISHTRASVVSISPAIDDAF